MAKKLETGETIEITTLNVSVSDILLMTAKLVDMEPPTCCDRCKDAYATVTEMTDSWAKMGETIYPGMTIGIALYNTMRFVNALSTAITSTTSYAAQQAGHTPHVPHTTDN